MAWGEEDGNDRRSFLMSDGVAVVLFLAVALGIVHLFGCWPACTVLYESEPFESQGISSEASFEIGTPCHGVPA